MYKSWDILIHLIAVEYSYDMSIQYGLIGSAFAKSPNRKWLGKKVQGTSQQPDAIPELNASLCHNLDTLGNGMYFTSFQDTSMLGIKWLYPPLHRSWKGDILVSSCPSVHLSVCGQNCVRSVSSPILIGSISYLHILSSNCRMCVLCNISFKILTNSLNL